MIDHDLPIPSYPKDADRPIRGFPIDGIPPPPEGSVEPQPPRFPTEPVGPRLSWVDLVFAVGAVALVALLAISMGLAAASDSTVPPSVTPAPMVRELTQAQVDEKMPVIAKFLGRGQPHGADQVTRDLLSGTACAPMYVGYNLYDRKTAVERNATFRREAGQAEPDALLATAVVKAEEPAMVKELLGLPPEYDGKFIAAGILIRCQ